LTINKQKLLELEDNNLNFKKVYCQFWSIKLTIVI